MMTSTQVEIQLIGCLVAIACAIPGTFLVLRKMALISDAISHSILPGIVLGFFIAQDVNSPLLIFMGTLSGVLTVVMVEYIQKTNLVKEDTAIGLVFPALFSIGIILISKNASDIHLDVDAVLLGELAFTPFERFLLDGVDFGPKALWIIGSITIMSIGLLITFFKELKLSTFDAGLATALGFSPIIIHYSLMTLASITIVGSFDAVGAILVIALMIAPSATAYLLTNELKKMLLLSISFGIIAAIGGYWLANILDASIAGSMTVVLGLIFMAVYFFAPEKGIIASMIKNKKQNVEVLVLTLLAFLKKQQKPTEIKKLNNSIKIGKVSIKKIIELALTNELITSKEGNISITKKGIEFSEKAVSYFITNEDDDIKEYKDKFYLFK